MKMIDSRKFRRKRKQATPAPDAAPEDLSPIEPLERPADRRAREAELAAAQDARAQAERDAQAQAERDAKAKAERDAKRQAAANAKAQAALQAKQQADREAAKHAAEQAQAKAALEAQQQAELQAQAEAEARAKEQAEQEAREQAQAERDAKQKAEAEAEATRARRAFEAQTAPDDRSHAADPWAALSAAYLDLNHLNKNRVITADRLDPAHSSFDVLRTRLMHALHERGWKRVAVTSPGKNCGKTFSVANLAISLSRQENTRTLVMDFDLRRPSLHKVLGLQPPLPLGDMLRGTSVPDRHLLRLGDNSFDAGHNLAFAVNDTPERYASELLQDPRTQAVLDDLDARLSPDVMLFDLPPALFYDDVIAFQPQFDGVLLVVGGGLTTEREIKEVERRLGPDTPLLGMVLNKAEGVDSERYAY
ncbi:CpsD/CapB family tyrosine-protein kinase [Sagittula sp. SSi028]|uniref:CpsD/CapB family tyrosine-protein kinase n=1 Tax=Sagittula sp. SSi028 TaxID=3400636 RepID=UPI003AF6992E